jgi:hypothetical protein
MAEGCLVARVSGSFARLCWAWPLLISRVAEAAMEGSALEGEVANRPEVG